MAKRLCSRRRERMTEFIDEGLNCSSVDELAATVFRHFHALFDVRVVSFASIGKWEVRQIPSRLVTEEEVRTDLYELYDEQCISIRHPFGPIFTTSAIPEPLYKESATYQLLYRPHEIEEGIGLSLVSPREPIGSVSLCLRRKDREVTSRTCDLLLKMRNFIIARLDEILFWERRELGADDFESLDRAGIPAFVIDAEERVRWASRAGLRLIERSEPEPLTRLAHRCLGLLEAERNERLDLLHRMGAEWCTLGGCRFLARHRLLPGVDESVVLVMLDGSPPPMSQLIVRRCKALGLTGRQTEVAIMAADGFRNEQIAVRHGMATETVKKHMQHIFERTGAQSRTELLSALSAGALEPGPTDPDVLLRKQCRKLGLTERQTEIALMVGEGCLNKQIAYDLGIANGTVKKHLQRIYRRTGTKNRTELVRLLVEAGRPDSVER